jgi:glutaredoxin/glutathione-dependent peroxiredoxin
LPPLELQAIATQHAKTSRRGLVRIRRKLSRFTQPPSVASRGGSIDDAGMIKTGDAIPAATLYETTEFGEACPLSPKPVAVTEALQGKRVVIFGLPGAYTPTCSAKHLPGYLARLAELKGRGVDEVWCVSVNDGYVMAAWGRDQGAIGKIRMLGDGNGDFARKLGLDDDKSKSGMGVRSRRFSLLVKDGIVERVNVEEPGKFEVSGADTMLNQVG